MRRLLEGVLDLETKAINAHDLHGIERQVGRYQHDGPPRRVNNRDEAHKLPDRAPQEIAHAIADLDAALAIDGADKLFHRPDIGQQRFELDLLAIALRSAPRPGPKGSVIVKVWIRFSILSSRVRWSRLDHTRPSWIRTASGTAKTLDAALTSRATACSECPMMYSGLVLQLDC